MKSTTAFLGIKDRVELIHDSLGALRALDLLIYYAMREGDAIGRDDTDGISFLFKGPFDNIENALKGIDEQISNLTADTIDADEERRERLGIIGRHLYAMSEPKGATSADEKIAPADAAEVQDVERPFAEAGTMSRHLAEGPIPDHFRAEALAERLNEGVDAAKIAKAVNLKPETVERVIAQLMAEPGEDGKATGTEG